MAKQRKSKAVAVFSMMELKHEYKAIKHTVNYSEQEYIVRRVLKEHERIQQELKLGTINHVSPHERK